MCCMPSAISFQSDSLFSHPSSVVLSINNLQSFHSAVTGKTALHCICVIFTTLPDRFYSTSSVLLLVEAFPNLFLADVCLLLWNYMSVRLSSGFFGNVLLFVLVCTKTSTTFTLLRPTYLLLPFSYVSSVQHESLPSIPAASIIALVSTLPSAFQISSGRAKRFWENSVLFSWQSKRAFQKAWSSK